MLCKEHISGGVFAIESALRQMGYQYGAAEDLLKAAHMDETDAISILYNGSGPEVEEQRIKDQEAFDSAGGDTFGERVADSIKQSGDDTWFLEFDTEQEIDANHPLRVLSHSDGKFARLSSDKASIGCTFYFGELWSGFDDFFASSSGNSVTKEADASAEIVRRIIQSDRTEPTWIQRIAWTAMPKLFPDTPNWSITAIEPGKFEEKVGRKPMFPTEASYSLILEW